MNHRYPYDPSVEYLEEGVRGNGRGRLTNACVIGILRGDKKKRIGLRKQLSCDREARLISRNRESFVKSRKGELLRNILLSTAKYFFGTLHVLHNPPQAHMDCVYFEILVELIYLKSIWM